MSQKVDEIKEKRLKELPFFETLEEAILNAQIMRKTTDKYYGLFKKEIDGVEKYTISITRDWELLVRTGFEKIEGLRY